jgi:hypothetical protein
MAACKVRQGALSQAVLECPDVVTPSGAAIQLIKMLDRHPELVDELR